MDKILILYSIFEAVSCVMLKLSQWDAAEGFPSVGSIQQLLCSGLIPAATQLSWLPLRSHRASQAGAKVLLRGQSAGATNSCMWERLHAFIFHDEMMIF